MSELLHITIFNQYQFQYTILISIMDVPTIADALPLILRTFTEEDDVDSAVEAQDEEKGENAEDDDEDGFDLISKMYIKSSTRKAYNSHNKNLLLWLYSTHPSCLQNYVKDKLDATLDKDRESIALYQLFLVLMKITSQLLWNY